MTAALVFLGTGLAGLVVGFVGGRARVRRLLSHFGHDLGP